MNENEIINTCNTTLTSLETKISDNLLDSQLIKTKINEHLTQLKLNCKINNDCLKQLKLNCKINDDCLNQLKQLRKMFKAFKTTNAINKASNERKLQKLHKQQKALLSLDMEAEEAYHNDKLREALKQEIDIEKQEALRSHYIHTSPREKLIQVQAQIEQLTLLKREH